LILIGNIGRRFKIGFAEIFSHWKANYSTRLPKTFKKSLIPEILGHDLLIISILELQALKPLSL